MKEELAVIPEKGMWIVKRNSEIQSIHLKRESAVRVAKIIAHNHHIDLKIHGRNGDIFKTRPL